MACEREEFQTRNPAAAAAIPPRNQTNFFMRASLPPSIINQNGRAAEADVLVGPWEDNGAARAQEPRCERRKGRRWLDDGVMVGPGGLETVGEFFYGLHAVALPYEEAYECCCQAACQPN